MTKSEFKRKSKILLKLMKEDAFKIGVAKALVKHCNNMCKILERRKHGRRI